MRAVAFLTGQLCSEQLVAAGEVPVLELRRTEVVHPDPEARFQPLGLSPAWLVVGDDGTRLSPFDPIPRSGRPNASVDRNGDHVGGLAASGSV